MPRASLFVPVALVVLLAGCSTSAPATAPAPISAAADAPTQRFPDITDVQVTRDGGQYSFAVTISSPYDSPERYADAFRVRSTDGTIYGVNELDHDHATEQPFTRTLAGVAVPAGVRSVVVEGRDRSNGWGGGTRTVSLPS